MFFDDHCFFLRHAASRTLLFLHTGWFWTNNLLQLGYKNRNTLISQTRTTKTCFRSVSSKKFYNFHSLISVFRRPLFFLRHAASRTLLFLHTGWFWTSNILQHGYKNRNTLISHTRTTETCFRSVSLKNCFYFHSLISVLFHR